MNLSLSDYKLSNFREIKIYLISWDLEQRRCRCFSTENGSSYVRKRTAKFYLVFERADWLQTLQSPVLCLIGDSLDRWPPDLLNKILADQIPVKLLCSPSPWSGSYPQPEPAGNPPEHRHGCLRIYPLISLLLRHLPHCALQSCSSPQRRPSAWSWDTWRSKARAASLSQDPHCVVLSCPCYNSSQYPSPC